MADSQALLNFFTVMQNKGGLVVTEFPKFELETYISGYSGRGKFNRLIHIGTSSVPLCVEALKAAVVDAKKGKDVNAYNTAQGYLSKVAPNDPDAIYDRGWIDSTTRDNQNTTKELEAQLKTYKNNLVKESIRMGHEDLAKHLWATGALPQAFEALAKMRVDVQTVPQVIETSKLMIQLSIHQRNWMVVLSHVQKIRSLRSEDKSIQPFLQIATGLSHLSQGQYREAANAFLATDSTEGFDSIITQNDVAIYGSLLALATMDRNEMQTEVLDSPTFRAFLEVEPHLRRAITFFVNSRFPACLDILANHLADYKLDLWLFPHISTLYQLVRSKAIVQYFIPFSCVTLDSMGAMFGSSGKPIDDELVDMIERGVLEGRIDTQNRLLTSVPSLARSVLQSQTLDSAHDYAREARRRMQRMNLINGDLEVKGQTKYGKLSFNDSYGNNGGFSSSGMSSSQHGDSSGSFVDPNGFHRTF